MTGHAFADAVLVVHAAVVIFLVGGALYVWVGVWRNWPGIRSPVFRYTHLAIMLYVATLSAIGSACPLTKWEDALRGEVNGSGFIARWIGRILFYDLPGWVFTTVYISFAGALIVSLVLIRPGKDSKRSIRTEEP